MEETSSPQGTSTITIKKESLWKYSTFILAAVLIVGAFIFFRGSSGTTGNVVAGSDNGAAVDVSAFANNPDLYPSIGSDDAKATVIEFSDFQCPFCAMASGLPAFAQQYASQYADLIGSAKKVENLAIDGKIKFVYVPMSFLGAESGYASEAALCANDQGKFFEMHEALFTAHDGEENNGKFNKDKLKVIAKSVSGLDQTKFTSCLDGGKYSSTTSEINTAANNAGVSGTPTFFVNGEKSSGSWTELSGKLKSAGVSI